MTRPLLGALVCAALMSLIAAPALAHAELVSATPGPGSEVESSPPELVATFNQDLDTSRTSLEVRDASGAAVAKGGELGDGPREFRLALPRLAPGKYSVRWTSFSAEDGELARDSYTFTVLAAPSPSPTPTPTPSVSTSPSPTPVAATPSPSPDATPLPGGTDAGGDGVVLLPILAASLVVGALGVWLLRRRRA